MKYLKNFLKNFLFIFIVFFIFCNLKIASAQECDVYLKASTDPEHVFHPIFVNGYYIPDPTYNVWPGPEPVTICWTTANNETVYSGNYQAASVILQTDPNAYLLDVRTPEEWFWVGHPGKNKIGEGDYLEGKVINVAYKVFVYDIKEGKYTCILNKFFTTDVLKAIENLGTSNPLIITMCRSGHRSVSAGEGLEEPFPLRLLRLIRYGRTPESVRAARKLEANGINVKNMLTGFEGGKDERGYRTLEQGWKNLGLPYNYNPEGAYWRPDLYLNYFLR